ncbi:MAG: phosphopentomutase [Ignavibacteriales bacterium]|nr:phosphopentomutase [Ignavibacteriales bacterium]
MQRKILLTILDGVGIGELPDAKKYGDEGSNTLANCANAVGNLTIPNLQKLGIGNIVPIKNVPDEKNPLGNFGKLAEVSSGKDSTTGHWEIAGAISEKDFPYYTKNGFPKTLLDSFLKETDCKGYLGNKAASGTEIIKELGEEHQRTGFPIVYTSADSVFQIAAHEETIPLERLYEICKLTREKVCVSEHAVGRIIARPFIGTIGNYSRTTNRRDFALLPPKKTLLNCFQEQNIKTIGIGKIGDLFSEQGLDEVIHTKSNLQGIEKTISECKKNQDGFIFSNLVDFDQLYGHRRNPQGFAKSLEEFDLQLPNILASLNDNDWFFVTGDHGNDPTFRHTDHTREYIPVLCFSKNGKHGVNIGTRSSFADLGKTIGRLFGLNGTSLNIDGTSFHELISL